MANYRRKKIFVTKDKTKYVWCYLFETNEQLNEFYKKSCKERGHRFARVNGVSIHFTSKYIKTGKVHPYTGQVLLSKDQLGAGIVAHEFTHACIWAYRHHLRKKAYPFILRSMADEENFVRGQTVAIIAFWTWYYKFNKK